VTDRQKDGLRGQRRPPLRIARRRKIIDGSLLPLFVDHRIYLHCVVEIIRYLPRYWNCNLVDGRCWIVQPTGTRTMSSKDSRQKPNDDDDESHKETSESHNSDSNDDDDANTENKVQKLRSFWPSNYEKSLGETRTLRAGCSKAEPKIFAPSQTPFPRARDGQNLIIWKWSLPSPTDPVWWGSMHAISSYRGNRPTKTNKQTNTNPQTDRTDYNTLCR